MGAQGRMVIRFRRLHAVRQVGVPSTSKFPPETPRKYNNTELKILGLVSVICNW